MRAANRKFDELRKVEIIPDVNSYAEGSCLIKCGNTHVICTASVENKVPQWLKDSGKGWITAEYALLPRATHTRVNRETHGTGGRTHEIQRLIGRSMRAVVNLEALEGYLITLDCDVIQADGGTRTAAITGSFVALTIALKKMVRDGLIPVLPIRESVAAVSVGICAGTKLLDLEYEEDSNAQVDANFVLTNHGRIVEVQGTAEGEPFSKEDYNALMELAQKGINELIVLQQEALKNAKL